MKPTVSVTSASHPSPSATRRVDASKVAKSLSSTNCFDPDRAWSSDDLPALV